MSFNKDTNNGKIISVASGKGGTGKTVTSLNLAMELHSLGKDVTVVDADLEDPNIGINLGLYSPKSTINKSLENDESLIEAMHIHETGIKLVPASLSINYLNTNFRSLKDRFKDLGGYVIIDCGPGISEKVISCIDQSDAVVAVTNPMRSAVSGLVRLTEIVKDMEKDLEGIVVNNLTSKEITSEEISSITGYNVLGEIPYDINVDRSIINKEPLVKYKPYSKAAIAYKKIAHGLIDEDFEPDLSQHIKRYTDLFLSKMGLNKQ